jgi:uncharacterized protein
MKVISLPRRLFIQQRKVRREAAEGGRDQSENSERKAPISEVFMLARGKSGLLPSQRKTFGSKRSILIESASSADLEPAPISADWILSGSPQARSRLVTKSGDRTSSIMVWECTAGRFNWHYSEDETVVVVSGEVFITTEKGEETRLGQGDIGFFPAGCSCTWRVTDRIRKVAVLRKDLPPLLGIGVRGWHLLLRIVGLRGKPSLVPAAGF